MSSCSLRIFLSWNLPDGEVRKGVFAVRNGRAFPALIHHGEGHVTVDTIEFKGGTRVVLELPLEISTTEYGKNAPLVRWECGKDSFAFLPHSLPETGQIFAPDLGVSIARTMAAVKKSSDPSPTYQDAIRHEYDHWPEGREIGWDYWASRNNEAPAVPTILGFSRDRRMFIVEPVKAYVTAAEKLDKVGRELVYELGHPISGDDHYSRSLEDDCLPILHYKQKYGGLLLEETFFVSFADRPLTHENLEGNSFLRSHLYSMASAFPDGVKEKAEQESDDFTGEVALFIRTRLTNTTDIPLLAAQIFPRPVQTLDIKGIDSLPVTQRLKPYRMDESGIAWVGETPLARHRFNGEVPESLQPCLLLSPGKSMTLDSVLAHHRNGFSEKTQKLPISWEKKLMEVRTFWNEKLATGTTVSLPEKRLTDFWKAGLSHLEMVTLGKSKDGPLLAKVGFNYTAIGTESLPIVEFFNSVGLQSTAQRCIDAFFDLQHPNGRINIFHHYDIETGGVLFMSGRHYAYSKDKEWLKKRLGNLKQAANYLLSLRQLENSEAPDYGLILGTCADPEEQTAAYMLNSYNAVGLCAVAEMLEALQDEEVGKYRKEADHYVSALQRALAHSFSEGPLLPTHPNRWVPSCAPHSGGLGPEMLGLKGEACFSHRTYNVNDTLLGPLYAVFTGVISPESRLTQWLLEINHSQFNRGAIGEAQPYYCRHPEVHLLRGEREAFLNAFYSGLTTMADRETFSFWEHIFRAGVHKTHEEGWALMQLRRMLWLEAGSELRLLAGIPEAWLDAGQLIEVENAGSYFGSFSFRLKREEDEKSFQLQWNPNLHTAPATLKLHLPGIGKIPKQKDIRISSSAPEWLEIKSPLTALDVQVSLEA
ncbi:MAG: hypothetical protein ABI443_13750 [Chthoniobacterales bacterium]